MKKIKTYSRIVLGLGLFLVLVSFLILAVEFVNVSQNGGIAIIGAADLSVTFRVIFSDYLPSIIIGFTIVVCAAFCLIFSKTVINNCTLKTTAVSLGISFASASGLYCFFTWYTIAVFGEMWRHPIRFPASRIIGLLSFAAFVFLIVLYCRLRKQKFSVKGILIDVATCLIAFLPFSIIITIVSNFVSLVFNSFYK